MDAARNIWVFRAAAGWGGLPPPMHYLPASPKYLQDWGGLQGTGGDKKRCGNNKEGRATSQCTIGFSPLRRVAGLASRIGDIEHVETATFGTTWVSQASGTSESLTAVSFTDANTGTAVGGGGTILRATDGGTTWVSQMSGTGKLLSDVSFTDGNTGTAVGSGGTILRQQLQ
jgi:hypothetical protein